MSFPVGRYIVFMGERYYPLGGAKDQFVFKEDLGEARGVAEGWTLKSSDHWAHVFDLETQKIVYKADKIGEL
jgi:hypothetical protein